MMTNDMMIKETGLVPPLPEAGWLSGLLAGLDAVRRRGPDWLWRPFIEDMHHLTTVLGVDRGTGPGDTPPVGTALAALGGYISATGDVKDGHLNIPIPFLRGDVVRDILQCEGAEVRANSIRVPMMCIDSLLSRVTLDGPVLELLEGVE